MNKLNVFRPVSAAERSMLHKILPHGITFNIVPGRHDEVGLSFAWANLLLRVCPTNLIPDFTARIAEVERLSPHFLPPDLQKQFHGQPADMRTLLEMTKCAQTQIASHSAHGYATYFDRLYHELGLKPCLFPLENREQHVPENKMFLWEAPVEGLHESTGFPQLFTTTADDKDV